MNTFNVNMTNYPTFKYPASWGTYPLVYNFVLKMILSCKLELINVYPSMFLVAVCPSTCTTKREVSRIKYNVSEILQTQISVSLK